MAYIIKKSEANFTCVCELCNSEIGYYEKDIITRPSVRYPSALMIEYIKCPNCDKITSVGGYYKSMRDEGNYKEKTTDEDWR